MTWTAIQIKKLDYYRKNLLVLSFLLTLQSCDMGTVNSKPAKANSLKTQEDFVPPASPEDLVPDEFQAQEDEDTGIDPLSPFAWHLKNTGLQDGFSANRGVIGEDVNGSLTYTQGVKGRGVRIAISDNGVELSHPDLQSNVLTGLSRNYQSSNSNFWRGFDPTPGTSQSTAAHGTGVTGLAVARDRNNIGLRGIAPLAKFAGFKFVGAETTLAKLIDQADGDFDIFNYSYGRDTCSYSKLPDSFHEQLKYGATSLRSGKGAFYIKAAGNEYISYASYCDDTSDEFYFGNANFESDHSYPYVIVVGANDARGFSSVYSTPGSSLWISAPGGAYGITYPALLSTDLTGCNQGFSHEEDGENEFDLGNHSLNSNCDYTSTMNGTSGAAPIVSGAIALLLEVNPALNWREVKYILAKSARKIDRNAGNTSHPRGDNLSGHTYQFGWLTNSAGFHFHNWYGFGAIDIDRAVAMARSWNKNFGSFIETGWLQNTNQQRTAIPDNSSTGLTLNLNINRQLRIEAVQVRLTIDHERARDLGVELRSPSGMRTKLVNINSGIVDNSFVDYQVLSNAFYMENSAGVWTLTVVDGKAEMTGEMVDWKLNFFGHTETSVSPRGSREEDSSLETTDLKISPSAESTLSEVSAASLLSRAVTKTIKETEKGKLAGSTLTANESFMVRTPEPLISKETQNQVKSEDVHSLREGKQFGDLTLPNTSEDHELKMLLSDQDKTWAIGLMTDHSNSKVFLVERQKAEISRPNIWSSPESHSLKVISSFLNEKARPSLLLELKKKDHPVTWGLLQFTANGFEFHQIDFKSSKLLFGIKGGVAELQLIFESDNDELLITRWSMDEGITEIRKISFDLKLNPKFFVLNKRVFMTAIAQENSKTLLSLNEIKKENISPTGRFFLPDSIAEYRLGLDDKTQSFYLFAEKEGAGMLKELKAHDLALYKLVGVNAQLIKSWTTPDEEYVEDYQVGNGVHSLLASTRSNFKETNLGERDIVFIDYDEATQSESIQHWGRDQQSFRTSGDEMNLKFLRRGNDLEIWGETTGPFIEPNQSKSRDLFWFPWRVP